MELMVHKYRLVDQERRDLFVKNLKEEGLICEFKSKLSAHKQFDLEKKQGIQTLTSSSLLFFSSLFPPELSLSLFPSAETKPSQGRHPLA